MAFVVRRAIPEELHALSHVELQAATRFDTESVVSGLSKQALPIEQLRQAQAYSALWVACTAKQELVGFLAAEHL